MEEGTNYTESLFEAIRHVNEYGQELIENYEQLSEDQKRLAIREEMRKHNKLLVVAARDAGRFAYTGEEHKAA